MSIKKSMARVALIGLLTVSILGATMVRTSTAHAFSGSGAGTGGDPFLISSCAQLIEVDADLAANYKLTQDIDCSANGNDIIINDAFTGSFNGQSHAITYALTDVSFVGGLFSTINGATVQNLTLNGTLDVSGASVSHAGALAADIYNGSTISHITVNVGITGSTIYGMGGIAGAMNSSFVDNIVFAGSVNNGGNGPTGGFFGYMYCTSTVSDSHSSGSVSANGGFTGGITGDDECEGPAGTYSRVYNTGSVTNIGDNVGGIVGRGWTTTFYQVYNTGYVEGINNVGGIAGLLDYSSLVYQSYSSGLILAYGNSAGGLVGYLAGESNINESYAIGAVTTQSNYAGGILGYLDTGSAIADTYARGDVHGNAVGGLVGRAWSGSISRSYATGAVDGQNEDHGGLVAITDISGDNGLFWNTETSVSTSVMGHGKTTAEMKDIATYTDSSTEGLGQSIWDFTGTPNNDAGTNELWSIHSSANDGYPCLNWDETCTSQQMSPDTDGDGVRDNIEDAGPNSGDANNDEIADKTQDSVVAVSNQSTNKDGVLELSQSCEIQEIGLGAVSALPVADKAYTYPHGMFEFIADCGGTGSTFNVKQFYYDVDLTNFVVRKYNTNTQKYATIEGATVSQTTIDGRNVVVAEYQVTDGGPLDMDGVANGVIRDPAGLGLAAVGAPNTRFGGVR